MSLFDEVNAGQSEFFVDADLMGGEEINILPKNGARVDGIWAIVNRSPKATISEITGSRPTINMRIVVRNSSTLGINLLTLNTGGDRVEVAKRYGDTTLESRQIANVLNQDGGMIVLEVR